MKKYNNTNTQVFMLLAFTAQAEMRAGLSLSAGVFDVDGASEKFSGSHSSGAGVYSNKKYTETDAEGIIWNRINLC